MSDRRSIAALGVYVMLTMALFSRALLGGVSDQYLGVGHDPSFLMWALVWWPHALRAGLNPFMCRIVWAPDGFNLAWSGGIPLPALAAAPLTHYVGPVATYNLLALAVPVAAAWCAFILCRQLSGSWWAGLFGGYVFGFSPYVLGQMLGGHLNLLLVFPGPLLVLSVVRSPKRLASARMVAIVAALLVVQFLCSIEIAATTVLFGTLTLLIATRFAPPTDRLPLRHVAILLALAGGVAIALLTPYLYYLLRPGAPHSAINSPGAFSADLLNLIIPTRTALLGTIPALRAIARSFPGNDGERDAYLGLPLLFVIIHYGWIRRHDRPAHLLLTMLAVVVVCALGPRLHVAGWTGFGMPWKAATHLPLIKSALPDRFMNYAFLAAAIIVARWMVDTGVRWELRAVMTALIIGSLLPNFDAAAWTTKSEVPPLFATRPGSPQIYPDDTLVALPFGITGDSMLWQASSRMSFRMAGGYTGITPREYQRWPIVGALMTATDIPDASFQLRAFMAAHSADAVVVDDAHQGRWSALLNTLDPSPQHTGGVWIYRPAAGLLAAYRGLDPAMLEQRNAAARFDVLLKAAAEYLRARGDAAALTPWHAQELGLLPPHWAGDKDVRTNNGLYLGPWPGGKIAIGVVGSWPALQPLVEQYRSRAATVLFPFPQALNGEPRGDTFMRLLVMVFDPAKLSVRAAPP